MGDGKSRQQRYLELIERGAADELRSIVTTEPALLEVRTSPSYAPERQLGCTGLHAAVHAGQPGAARVLVESGIDLEVRTTEGRTALHDSIELGQPRITEMLLEAGASLQERGLPARPVAERKPFREIAAMLRAAAG